jgi:hypothetical protein
VEDFDDDEEDLDSEYEDENSGDEFELEMEAAHVQYAQISKEPYELSVE